MKLVTLSYAPSLQGFDERPLADFVRDKEVLAVREHFFTVHDLPHLACLITYQEAANQAQQSREERPRENPLESLAPEDRSLYNTLREWRAARAHKEGVPPYILFTNREIIEIVRARPKSLAGLQALDGIGPAKVEKYGARILELVNGTTPGSAP